MTQLTRLKSFRQHCSLQKFLFLEKHAMLVQPCMSPLKLHPFVWVQSPASTSATTASSRSRYRLHVLLLLLPTVRIFNAKPIEASSQNENSRKGNMQNKDEDMPDRDSKDTKTKDKRKRSKQQVQSPEEPAAKGTPLDATIAAPVKSGDSKKNKKEKVVVEHDKKSKPKGKDDAEASSGDTDGKAKEPKKKKLVNKEDKDVDGMDDTEVSFADFVFSREAARSEPALEEKKTQGTAPDGKFVGGLVIDHTKKRKKSQGTFLDASDLKLLSSVPEVGVGGLSGWD